MPRRRSNDCPGLGAGGNFWDRVTAPLRLAIAASAVAMALAGAPPPVKFNRDIRPIMADTCFRCHGPDKSARMMGLRLDIREEALKTTASGVIPIVPGQPEKSAIVQRIFATNPAKIMPPPFSHKVLTAQQKDTIRRWVSEGAVYEKHWSYEPVVRPPVPVIAGAKLIRNPIDAFVQERLARERLRPSREADRWTLLRRVTLDLTGLPPTPEEMEAFSADSSPDAYEKVVNRLIASPRYAEAQAVHWLDAVRFADSAGFHGDNLVPTWPYRDYVLKAFRDNKPFDEFTREQIAGDLLPGAGVEQKIASAFNRLNRMSAEGGIQPKEYLAKYGADRVRTTSTVWLGATLGCAECHNHRFDPYSSKDFYSMKAFFADIRETGLTPDRGKKAWGSVLMLPSEEQERRLREVRVLLDATRRELEEKVNGLAELRWKWEDRMLAQHASGELAWKYQRPIAARSINGATLTIHDREPVDSNYYIRGSLASERKPAEGLVTASGANPDNETYIVAFKPGAGTWTALGIDIFQDESLPGNRLSRGADRFVLTEVEVEISDGAAPLGSPGFILATSTGIGEALEVPAMAAIDGDASTGWGVWYGEARNPFLALRFREPVVTGPETVMTVRLHHDSALRRAVIGRFRLALSSATHSWPELGDAAAKRRVAEESKSESATLTTAVDRGLPPDVLKAIEIEEPERTEEQQKRVLDHFAWSAPELEPLTVRIAQLEALERMIEAEIPRVVHTERMKPRVTRVLPRGNFLDESGEIVEPAIPAFFGVLKTEGRDPNRLDLANWIVSSDNPLTARVFVNRLWRRFFGTGLSKTVEDLGSQGEWPSHPELLDWLASEFMRPEWDAGGAHSWDIKHIVRLIVTSHTYRQSSLSTPALDERDPANRLLARQSRFRVDAETVRDIALAVSGLLVESFGGPSVRPVQPEGYLAGLNFPKREYSASRGPDLYRRGVYVQWQRTFLHPSLLTFDAPSREECTVNRVSSNTPLQALVLLNDPIYVEAARAFAENILKSGGASPGTRIDWAFLRALNRRPETKEREILTTLYDKNLAHFRAGPAASEAPELAAMTTVARVILNLHETITRD